MKPIISASRLGKACALALSLFSGVVPASFGQIPAFPGAQGFGAYATGGRGGDVYTVTNLNSSGTGSLNYGIQNAPASGRTIVFAVGGYIPIANNTDTGNKTVRVVQNKVTIAGQTAPGDGIGLKDGRILLTGNNSVMRHLRIRHGKYGGAGDCLNIESTANNCIVDHISLMFSTDENISFFSNAIDNFTMQYSTSSWGMERHNAGGLWDLQDGTCHHSLWAHHRTRNPKARPSLLEWINNVTYHWRGEGFIMGDSQSNTTWRANVRGCYFLSIADHQFGADNTALSKARIGDNGQPNFSLYLDNCLHDSDDDGLLDGTDKGYGIVAGQAYPAAGTTPGTVSYNKSATPFTGATGTATVTIDPPLTAYKKVLSSSGALRLNATYTGAVRDELDTLLINSVVNQESILVAKDTPLDANDTPSSGEALLAAAPYNISNGGFGTLNSATALPDSDGDGMPDDWEITLGWNSAVQDHNTALPSSGGIITGVTFFPANTPAGYTRLEEYLHFKASPHAFIPVNGTVDVDLRKYTGGFIKAPVVYTLSNVVNGTVSLLADGRTARFVPTSGFSGRARFDFSVSDGDGSTWTQTFLGLARSTTVPAIPPVPTGLAATAGNASVSLTWSASSGATSYNVKRATTSGGPYTTVASPSTASYNNTGLTNGTLYHYVVSAVNATGESANSSQASATPSIGVSTTIQAESANPIGGGVTIDTGTSSNAGWNGTGYTNFPTTGGFTQYSNINGGAGGQATLAIRFALNGTTSRTGNLVINGVTQSITFPGTNLWSNWTIMNVSIPLTSGSSNIIRFESNGADLANLDEFTVTPTALNEVTIAATDASAGEYGVDQNLGFTISRTGATSSALTVPLTASGSAMAASDFAGLASSVIIPAGQGSVPMPLTVLSDSLSEGAETVNIALGASANFTTGSPASASATIADNPSQSYFFSTISDPAKRGPTHDADADSNANIIEYFMGSHPDNPGGYGMLTIPSVGTGTFKVRYPRAKNRPDVGGSLRWSPNMTNWFSSGQGNGIHTVSFTEAVVSAPAADPETVEATATITGPGEAPTIFVRLGVQ
ncbi:MAG: fibronectin type III domain-containing protein [Verrucomicrobiota bacterium]